MPEIPEIPEYTPVQLRDGLRHLLDTYGDDNFLGSAGGLTLKKDYPQMLRQLCAAGLVEKTPDKKGQDYYYKILAGHDECSLGADLPAAAFPAAKAVSKKGPVGKSVDGLADLVASQRMVISLLTKCSSFEVQVAELQAQVSKLQSQVAALSTGGVLTGGAPVDV